LTATWFGTFEGSTFAISGALGLLFLKLPKDMTANVAISLLVLGGVQHLIRCAGFNGDA
jgi:hypothetical protein